ncbi:MAG: TdeIII family type II restriction endonuclease [Candidatus Kapaibacterium sp.]
MLLTAKHPEIIKQILKNSLRKKFKSYNPETKHMPFHHRLLGKDRMALFSFIHSLNTTFGTSIFEPVAETLACLKYKEAKKQYIVGNEISENAQFEIQAIINDLSMGKNPNKLEELKRIQSKTKTGTINRLKTVKVDLFLLDHKGNAHLFDIKTAKPNISNFKDFKRTLLEWAAIYLTKFPDKSVNTYIAIPYNPYEPEPYQRWTMKGMLDLDQELKVANEFWDFLGGDNSYEILLKCFEEVGLEMRNEIDSYFTKFK